MNWEIARYVIFGMALMSSLPAAEPGSRITILVYNYAAVAPHVLARAEAEAARIYHHAGIEILWLDCPLTSEQDEAFAGCRVSPNPTTLAVRLLSQSMAELVRQAEDSFGFALYPADGGFATVSNVAAQNAKQFANLQGLGQPVLLGHLIAHEAGHLLLGSGSHSGSGIMHVPWRPKDLGILSQGRMLFSDAQASECARMSDFAFRRWRRRERRSFQEGRQRILGSVERLYP